MTIPIQEQQPHVRKVIRAKVCALLRANTFIGSNWFMSRPKPMWLEELPCGLIYFTDETADAAKTVPRSYLRTLNLTTEVLINDDSDTENIADDYLDSRAYEIEHTIFQDRFLQLKELVQDTRLTRTVPTILKFEGENDIASIRLFWEIDYYTDGFSPAILDEFLNFMAMYETTLGTENQDIVTIREGD